MARVWDLAIVGAGPAGSAAALGALAARPHLKVLLLDRATFPRDKSCGDGIAPHVLDVLAEVGVTGLLDDWKTVARMRLRQGSHQVSRTMARPARVVPRAVLDDRLVTAAQGAGAVLNKHRVRAVRRHGGAVVLDGEVRARVVVGADGAHSVVRAAAGLPAATRRALAIRGYGPTPDRRRDQQVIVFGKRRQPSYAWSFDRGDGLCNVGYGELLTPGRTPPSRAGLLEQLEALLPGAAATGSSWLGHHLPLSSWRWRQPDGPVLLAGDAAGLVNPMTGEGIYYAVATGVLAGRVAAGVLDAGDAVSAGGAYRVAVRSLLARHLRHTATASRLVSVPAVVSAGIRAASRDQAVFDDLVEVGLGQGLLTPRAIGGLVTSGRSAERLLPSLGSRV